MGPYFVNRRFKPFNQMLYDGKSVSPSYNETTTWKIFQYHEGAILHLAFNLVFMLVYDTMF